MQITIDCQHRIFCELRRNGLRGVQTLHHEDATADLGDLIDEMFHRAVLSETWSPVDCEELKFRIVPCFSEPPRLSAIEVEMQAKDETVCKQKFESGRWTRRAVETLNQLREEGSVEPDQTAFVCLEAGPDPAGVAIAIPPLQSLLVADGTLESCGVRALGEGSLAPDRPVLLSDRMIEEIVEWTWQAGAVEIGGATLGKIVRLPEPLPGTHTRFVTILSTSLLDERHQGEINRVSFSPEALAAAAEIAELRGLGETVMTVFHSHGFGSACGNCNESESCVLTECTKLSCDDYRVVESLFPSKSTLMPVAGRKLGATGRRPVLEVHAWRGGKLQPIRYQRFHE